MPGQRDASAHVQAEASAVEPDFVSHGGDAEGGIFIEAESGIAVQAVAAAERQAEGGNASQRFEKDLYFAGFGGFLRALRPGQAGEQQENRHHQAHDPEPDSV